jgi:hypothetical protein
VHVLDANINIDLADDRKPDGYFDLFIVSSIYEWDMHSFKSAV